MHSKSRKWCTKKTVISITWEQSYDTIWQEDDSTARITDRLIGTEWGSSPFSSNAGMKRYQKIAVCQLASQFGYLTYNLNTNGCLNIWKMSRRADAKHSCWRSSQQSHQFFLLKYPLNCIFSCWTTTLECTAPNPPFICEQRSQTNRPAHNQLSSLSYTCCSAVCADWEKEVSTDWGEEQELQMVGHSWENSWAWHRNLPFSSTTASQMAAFSSVSTGLMTRTKHGHFSHMILKGDLAPVKLKWSIKISVLNTNTHRRKGNSIITMWEGECTLY